MQLGSFNVFMSVCFFRTGYDIRLVQLHGSHRARPVVHGHELHCAFLYVHLLHGACAQYTRASVGQRVRHGHTDRADDDGFNSQRVDVSRQVTRRPLLPAVI